MNWNQLISAKRFGMEEFHEERQENRSEFQRDYDRLIFSAPFRRLQNKTQVFPLPGSIFVHNRLTHSLEVSCVGRSLGNDVAKAILERQPELQESFLPEIGSIVSAACLAHDLGNPPFGHSGERAISTFFSEGKGQFLKDKQPDGEQLSSMEWEDLTHFEGNANAFRLLTHQFEGRRKGGFAMTYTTLASIVKYPFSSRLAGMDIEDAHKLKILTTEETKELLMAYFNEERQAHIQKTFHIVNDTNEQIAYLRSSVIGLLIRECTRVFLEHEQEILSGTFEEALIKHISERPAKAYKHCAEVSIKKIYRSRDVLDIELAGFRVISTLLELMVDAVTSPGKAYSELLINRVSSQYNIKAPALYERIQAVLDYISGMTDVFALDLYRKINGNSLPAV